MSGSRSQLFDGDHGTRELGLGGDRWDELTPFEALLALAEGVFGLSLEEADIQRARPVARIVPVEGPGPGRDFVRRDWWIPPRLRRTSNG
jgi:hypothetical protein